MINRKHKTHLKHLVKVKALKCWEKMQEVALLKAHSGQQHSVKYDSAFQALMKTAEKPHPSSWCGKEQKWSSLKR